MVGEVEEVMRRMTDDGRREGGGGVNTKSREGRKELFTVCHASHGRGAEEAQESK
jgi:hypothetical protein